MEQIKDVRGSFRSFGWLYWLLLSNSGITFPFWEKVISAWNCSKRSQPLGYFRKRFDYGLQFGLHPGNIRYLEFIWILRRETFKGKGSDSLRKGGEAQGKGEVWWKNETGETEGAAGEEDGTRGGGWHKGAAFKKWGTGRRSRLVFI